MSKMTEADKAWEELKEELEKKVEEAKAAKELNCYDIGIL